VDFYRKYPAKPKHPSFGGLEGEPEKEGDRVTRGTPLNP